MSAALGLDLGGTNIKAVVIDDNGNIIASDSIPTESALGVRSVIDRMAKLMIDTAAKAGLTGLSAAGVTAPGVINSHEGTLELLPNFPPGWKGLRLAPELEQATGYRVRLLNDARAAAYGEKAFGAGKPYSSFICLAIGTGVGGGIVYQDTLLLGSRGVAGELGHLTVDPKGAKCGCGSIGCLETVASGPAIASAAIRLVIQGGGPRMQDMIGGDLHKLTAAVVCKAAEEGDAEALRILEKAVAALAMAIRNMIVSLNPQAVILGGGVAESAFFVRLVKERLQVSNLLFSEPLGAVDVIAAKHTVMAGAIGAAAWAMSSSRG